MIGILTEKPSAMRNFAKALGGKEGEYNGEDYIITAARGHLFGFDMPYNQVDKKLYSKYKYWNINNLPWDETDFNWKYIKAGDADDTLKKIKDDLDGCDEICIATDDDPTGEGELLAWEILSQLKLKPRKWSRMYFTDEAEKSIQKAFVNRKTIPSMEEDMDYVKALYRNKWDYMSMQFTRVATAFGDGKSVLRQGRLKSAMVFITGEGLKAVKEYKKIPFYQNRFRDENGVLYTNPDEPQYKSKDEVPNIYSESDVVCDSKEMKSTPPPKMLDLAGLSSILAAKGFKADEVLETYQKMYEDQIVSYPRTEDKEITEEQFEELLPLADDIADVVGVDKSLLTYRKPRKTHVKNGGAHGANRPGPNVPGSLSELDRYGRSAPYIYQILAKNYLATLAEDYRYELQKGHVKDYPKFKGSSQVPKFMGWKDIYSDDTADENAEESTKELGKRAKPFIFEGFPKKPPAPTMKWLMKQLEKRDVGTGATRTSIYADVTNEKSNYPLLKEKKGKLSMTEYGEMSYRLLPGTHIGSLDITEKVMKDMKNIEKKKADPDELLAEIKQMVIDDIGVMKKNGEKMREELGISYAATKEKYSGIWNGKEVEFSREWAGYRFSDEECEKLLNGETITIDKLKPNNSDKFFKVTGSLAVLTYKGKQYVGFNRESFVALNEDGKEDDNRCYGTWKGRQISFKRVWAGYRFSDEECEKLLAGETISITGLKSSEGNTYGVKGKLSEQKYQGRKYIGFEKTEFLNDKKAPKKTNGDTGSSSKASNRSGKSDADKCTGIWREKKVSFKKEWGGHKFTNSECEALLKGQEIVLNMKSKDGRPYSIKGKLEEQEYKGRKYVGFMKTDFIKNGVL